MTDPAPPALDPGELPTTGPRVLSGLIDAVTVIIGVFVLLEISLIGSTKDAAGKLSNDHAVFRSTVLLGGILLIGLVLFVIPEVRTGRSLGKRLLHTRIVLADGRTPGWGPLLIKYGLMFGLLDLPLALLPGLIVFFGWLSCIFNAKRRSLFDIVAGTYVVMDRRVPINRAES